MDAIVGNTQCGNCRAFIDESPSLEPSRRMPCPKCGSLARYREIGLAAKSEGMPSLRLKQKRWGFKKPLVEIVSEWSLHRKTGLWSFLFRRIDRAANRYVERISDRETGVISRYVDEPLTDHVGRGSAKKRPSV